MVPSCRRRSGRVRIDVTARHVSSSTIAGHVAGPTTSPRYARSPAFRGLSSTCRTPVCRHGLPCGEHSPRSVRSRAIPVRLAPPSAARYASTSAAASSSSSSAPPGRYPNGRGPPRGLPASAACSAARCWRALLRSTSPRATDARIRPTSRPASVERSRSPDTVATRVPVRSHRVMSCSRSASRRVSRSTCHATTTSTCRASTAASIASYPGRALPVLALVSLSSYSATTDHPRSAARRRQSSRWRVTASWVPSRSRDWRV